jgi:hypothetical protein
VGNVGWTFITTGVRALAGIAVGGYNTYRVSRHYFRRASDQQEEVATLETSNRLQAQAEKASAELKAQADRLHLVVTVLALHMERDGLLTGVERDERGLLKGVPQVVNVRPA